MLKVYSILDDKAQCFSTPYFAQNDLVASRSFSDLCNDSRSLVSQLKQLNLPLIVKRQQMKMY